MDLNTRIQKIIEYSMLTASEFADEIGVQRSNISHILSGRNKPSLDFIMKIKDRFPEIQWEWIIEGKGDMTSSSPTTPPEIMGSKINFEEEKEEQKFEPIPDLFSLTNKSNTVIPQNVNDNIDNNPNLPESNIFIEDKKEIKINDSQPLKSQKEETIQNQNVKIKKIVFFYDNGSFEIFEP